MQNLTLAQMWEVCLLALAVYREAANQSYIGKLAVAWSIRNRVTKHLATHKASWWGNTWEDVILKPFQYSSFNPSDPNATKIPGDATKDQTWSACLMAAQNAYEGTGIDPVNGATHYYAPRGVKEAPAWVSSAKFITSIGEHWFYIAS